MGQRNYAAGFEVTVHESALELPLRWKTPQAIFVNSMSDLFHEDVSDDFILRVFGIMKRASWHRFQVLTKRSARLAEMADLLPWDDHIWMGVSVETDEYAYRLDDLRKTAAAVKFVSLEPLLGPADRISLDGLDWVIVGGESGPGSRPMESGWVRDVRDRCSESSVPFFFKQWGGVNKKKAGRELDGRIWDETPDIGHAGARFHHDQGAPRDIVR